MLALQNKQKMLKKILPTLAKRNLKELTKRTSLFSISALEKKVRKNASARVKKSGKCQCAGKKPGKKVRKNARAREKSQEKCQRSAKKSRRDKKYRKRLKTERPVIASNERDRIGFRIILTHKSNFLECNFSKYQAII